jgi:hypothetical protein
VSGWAIYKQQNSRYERNQSSFEHHMYTICSALKALSMIGGLSSRSNSGRVPKSAQLMMSGLPVHPFYSIYLALQLLAA